LCDLVGERLVSTLGYTLVYSTLNNSLRPTNGLRALISQDFAGLGGDERYLRTRISAARYWSIGSGFVLSASAEGGAIFSFEEGEPGVDPILLTDRFTLGSPQMRGFDIRGVGPRVIRRLYDVNPNGSPVLDSAGNLTFVDDDSQVRDEAIGGRYYYLGHLELEIPVSNSIRELGIRPSVFADVGALWGVRQPNLLDLTPQSELTLRTCQAANSGPITCPDGSTLIREATPAFTELFVGDTPSPRVSVGFGVNWNSPFGPFRIDVAYPLLSQEGDDTRIFTFNVGTAF
jgi:outer membrane protein insertion porin family